MEYEYEDHEDGDGVGVDVLEYHEDGVGTGSFELYEDGVEVDKVEFFYEDGVDVDGVELYEDGVEVGGVEFYEDGVDGVKFYENGVEVDKLDYYSESGLGVDGLLAALATFGLFVFAFAVAVYVVNAIFLMKLLKNSGHKTPAAAWVPIWNTVSLMQVGGIKRPWIWALIFFGGNVVAGMIPYVGFIISLAILVAVVTVTIYLVKGVQAGVGTGSTGGIVLAILFPLIWVIWMAVASGKSKYDRDAAIREGSQMPFNWFGESDLYEPFGVSAPAAPSQHR